MFSKLVVKKSSYFSCFLLFIHTQTWRRVRSIREQIAVLTSWHRLRICQLGICCTISGVRTLCRNIRWFKSYENAGVDAKKRCISDKTKMEYLENALVGTRSYLQPVYWSRRMPNSLLFIWRTINIFYWTFWCIVSLWIFYELSCILESTEIKRVKMLSDIAHRNV